MGRPLSDVVVLDLTRALAGPIASRLLADLGAEVIKIEPPDGDLTRAMMPRVDGMSTYFVHYNAGKECVSLDLTQPEGRDLFLRMVEKADVVLENYRPEVMKKLDLAYETLAARNPRIIVASISGWGHNNSRANQGAYASALHAEAGITEMVARRRGEQDHPRNDPMSHSDTYTGLHALAALLAALYQRNRTGKGQAVEVSMAESTLMVNDLASAELLGEDPPVGFRAGQNWSAIYKLRSGRFVNITIDATTGGAFAIWVKATGRDDWRNDPRFATQADRIANLEAYQADIATWVANFDTAEELEKAIGVSTVLAAEVRTVPDLAATEWAAERGAFVDVDLGRGTSVTVPQSPWRFSDADSGLNPIVGFRGEHNREVLTRLLGLGDDELAHLSAEGIISSRVPEWRREA
ncbi:MAG: CoA transferase [Actinomycetota bacterium]|nr:CoA transferase [Actinomycetota bacterium]